MISVVVATIGPVEDLERLLTSLDAQTCRDFETIIVDQHGDDRLLRVLHLHPELNVRHLPTSERGASRARNAGIREAQGEIIVFPDDDCWYPPNLFAQIVEWFHAHPEYGALVGGTFNEHGKLMAPKFTPPIGRCSRYGILGCAMAVNMFLRASTVRSVGLLREDLGPGSSFCYKSGEDLDYVVRCFDANPNIWYDPAFVVYHPDLKGKRLSHRNTYYYALSSGYVCRLHGYPWWWFFGTQVTRSLAGAAMYLCLADLQMAYDYLTRAAGEIRGYLFLPTHPIPSVQLRASQG